MKDLSPTCSLSKHPQQPWLARSKPGDNTHGGVKHGWQGTKQLSHHPLPQRTHKQGARSEAEQAGNKLALQYGM